MKIFKLDSETRNKRLIRSAIIFPIALLLILYCNRDGFVFHIQWFLALLLLTTMITGFPYGWNLAKSIIFHGAYDYDDITGTYYHRGGVMIAVTIYPIAFTAGLFVGGFLFVVDLLMFFISRIKK